MSKMKNRNTEIKVLYDLAIRNWHDDQVLGAERRELIGLPWDNWDDIIYTADIAGVAHSLIKYGENGRWGKDPEETIRFLGSIAPFDNEWFHNWVVKYGHQFPHFLNHIYLHEGMRLLCIEHARELIRQRENQDAS